MTPADFARLAARFAEIIAGWPEYYTRPDGSPDEAHREELAAVLIKLEN